MDPQAQELAEKVKGANNVLVTVSANPSVDQLAACIGLTIFLNKQGKHATAVFSGAVPSTIEFLRPEETLEKNTDSLRDFIIALDKSKADKLRYKVEENVVKIFITPYKTSITQEDLDFSQGDFNVDVVLCVGVREQQDLDQAITAHGRILHDAVVISINNSPQTTDLASINWVNTRASSLSEMAVNLLDTLGKELMDGQIATSLLTGIVAETERFSNEKTSPETMRLSAELMAAGANQQLVASELQAPQVEAFTEVENPGEVLPPEASVNQDGTLEIDHPANENGPVDRFDDGAVGQSPTNGDDTPPSSDSGDNPQPDPVTNDYSDTAPADQAGQPDQSESQPEPTASSEPTPSTEPQPTSRMILQPPSTGGTLTANSVPDNYASALDPLTFLTSADSMTHSQPDPSPVPEPELEPAPQAEDSVTEAPAEEVSEPEALVLPEVDPSAAVDDTEPEPALEPTPEPAPQAEVEPAAEPQPVVPAPEPTQSNEATINIDPSGELHMPQAPTVSEPTMIPEPAPTPSDGEQAIQPDDAIPLVGEDVDEARNAVLDAINSMPAENLPPEPQAASGATGYLDVHNLPDSDSPTVENSGGQLPTTVDPLLQSQTLLDESAADSSQQSSVQLPPPPAPASPTDGATTPPTNDPAAAPPVPPPLPLDSAVINQIISQNKAP